MTARMLLIVTLGLLAGCGPRASEKAETQPALPEPGSDPPARQIADCGDLFRFDPDGTLSPGEYFKLRGADPQTESGGEGRLDYRAFDYEDTISRDGWMALGVVNARAKPGDARSIGGLLWVKDNASLLSGGGDSLVREGDKLKLSVEVGDVRLADGLGKCAQPYLVTLDDRGVLTAGGREVGRAQ